MRLRPPEAFDRAALRPAVGDHVWYEGQKYKVTTLGMRWVYMTSVTDGKLYMARLKDVVKVVEEPKAKEPEQQNEETSNASE